jgi:hypothetical protein
MARMPIEMKKVRGRKPLCGLEVNSSIAAILSAEDCIQGFYSNRS